MRNPHPRPARRNQRETAKLDVAGGETRKPPFLALNPKGKVSTLVRNDGSGLTEFGAIANWLARANPDRALIPAGPEAEAWVAEIMGYIEGTVHGQGFARFFKPSVFEPQDIVHQTTGIGASTVRAQGEQIIRSSFAILDSSLAHHDHAVGDTLTIADFALFYVAR